MFLQKYNRIVAEKIINFLDLKGKEINLNPLLEKIK